MAENDKRRIEAAFLQFVSGFGIQTLTHLGKIANPATGATSLDLPNARYSIDILGILQEKTRGNLTPEEDEYLSAMLRDLRLQYVEAAGKAASPAPEKAVEEAGAAGTA